MATTEQRTYCPVSKNAFADMRADLAKNGVSLPDAPDGKVPAPHGFTVGWHWENAVLPASPWLRIELTGSCFFGMAWAAIEEHVFPYVGR